MSVMRRCLGYAICLTGFSCGILHADSDGIYLSQVKPLLKERCYACHGSLKQEGGLRLDTLGLMLRGGDSGEAVTRGPSAMSSLLLERVSSKDVSDRMPPEHEGEPLNPKELSILRNWIESGAAGPADEIPEADPSQHWAFLPVIRPKHPQDANEKWCRNPIDFWISSGHQRHDLIPQPEASRVILLRRLSLDLIGVPPTTEEIAACEADTSPDWYEKIVDRLLNDPRYGERWGRHWMDIWRYSDWWGLNAQLRNSQRHLWHWRDWIIESLNKDTPYDEMVRMMLAADELTPDDFNNLRATGYLARNYYLFNRNQWLDETVEHVSKGLLGLTMNCAKCHDHKYDPINQAAFYQFRAFFEPYQVRMEMIPGETDLVRDGIPRVFDGLLETPTYLFVRGEEARPDKSNPILPGVPEILEFEELHVQPVNLPETAWQPGLRQWVLDNHLVAARKSLQSAVMKRDQAAKSLNAITAPSERNAPPFQSIHETFATLDQLRWKLNGDGWIHLPGKMEQKRDGPVRSTLTLLDQAPENFDATLRFQIQGGSRWRSVGLTFDGESSSPTNSSETGQLVYLSGAAEDSKIQGAFLKEGKWNYPPAGRKPLKVEIGKEYTLHIRARGSLINVSLNGEPVLSWRTPLARCSGSMQLTTYDAIATFHEFRLSALENSVSLQEPDASANNTEEAFELAEADVNVAQAELNRVEQCVAAMLAQRDHATLALQTERRIAAIQAERQLAVAKAQRDLLAAQHALKKTEESKRKDAEKKLASAKEKLEKATASENADILLSENFMPLKGAEWSATRFLNTGKDDPEVTFPKISTGRRTALARWITDRRNPLPARVAVNHLWNRHFGEPLAPSPFDLGRGSPEPAHPELIDWLASELMDHNWSMKHLHRLIVTSATYRMSSSLAGADVNVEKDPDNRYWWRRVPIRIESQVVRDSVLSLAGTLDLTMGGPSVPPNEQETSKRRSLYFFHSNNDRNLFLSTFDEAEVTECYRREQSVVPQQALALTNSQLVLDSAKQIADRIFKQSANEKDFVKNAFLIVLGITASETELTASINAMERWKNVPDGSAEQARSHLIWILLNHNDFVTLR